MQIQSISNNCCFQGRFEINPLFNKFKEELPTAQRDIFEKQMLKIEKENDGRVFKFDRFINPLLAGGAEVGIFEKKVLIDNTAWIPLFTSTREKAAACFDELNRMYKTV